MRVALICCRSSRQSSSQKQPRPKSNVNRIFKGLAVKSKRYTRWTIWHITPPFNQLVAIELQSWTTKNDSIKSSKSNTKFAKCNRQHGLAASSLHARRDWNNLWWSWNHCAWMKKIHWRTLPGKVGLIRPSNMSIPHTMISRRYEIMLRDSINHTRAPFIPTRETSNILSRASNGNATNGIVHDLMREIIMLLKMHLCIVLNTHTIALIIQHLETIFITQTILCLLNNNIHNESNTMAKTLCNQKEDKGCHWPNRFPKMRGWIVSFHT